MDWGRQACDRKLTWSVEKAGPKLRASKRNVLWVDLNKLDNNNTMQNTWGLNEPAASGHWEKKWASTSQRWVHWTLPSAVCWEITWKLPGWHVKLLWLCSWVDLLHVSVIAILLLPLWCRWLWLLAETPSGGRLKSSMKVNCKLLRICLLPALLALCVVVYVVIGRLSRVGWLVTCLWAHGLIMLITGWWMPTPTQELVLSYLSTPQWCVPYMK